MKEHTYKLTGWKNRAMVMHILTVMYVFRKHQTAHLKAMRGCECDLGTHSYHLPREAWQ